MPYFNFRANAVDVAEASYWERRDFVNAWWAIYQEDARWTPPIYLRFVRDLAPRTNDHLARLQARLVYIDALFRTGLRRGRTGQQEIPLTSVLERPLAAAMPIIDHRRRGRTAHLALLQLANDAETFDHLHGYLRETLSRAGYRRLIGPVGLSPHLGSGVLIDSWDEPPPAHAPTNPPYLPELLASRWRPFLSARLYRAAVPPAPEPPHGPAVIKPFDPQRLAGDLLPLLSAVTDNPAAGFPPPDATEAALLLRQTGPAAVALLAEIDGTAAGFVLLHDDTGGRQRHMQGGRPLWGRAGLLLAGRRGTQTGRLVLGGVAPGWRGRGIGRQLWSAGLAAAVGRGWQSLAVGPVWPLPDGSSAAGQFLLAQAAIPRQTYTLYEAML